jgi:hypothetical protein
MARLAKSLPVWEQFAEAVRGFGPGSLAVIIGEAGDLSNYSTHSKLWKRMGLAVINGIRQGGLKKTSGKESWIEHGYSPLRRSRMWNIGDTLIKGNKDGPYRSAYLARKQYERDRAESNGITVLPAAKISKSIAAASMSDGHVHLRAQRYMEKRLLRDLWKAWRRDVTTLALRPTQAVPDDEIIDLSKDRADAGNDVPVKATTSLLPQQSIADAAQAAGQAILHVPTKARHRVPDHQ